MMDVRPGQECVVVFSGLWVVNYRLMSVLLVALLRLVEGEVSPHLYTHIVINLLNNRLTSYGLCTAWRKL